jgi:exosome complex component RRP4
MEPSAAVVTPGDTIGSATGLVHGRGTQVDASGTMLATAAGVVTRVNRVVVVRQLAARYEGEAGDVVVGRVVSVESRRWVVDVGAARHAVLHLSGIHLAGGEQRRRTLEDQMRMRDYLREGDLLPADVQEVQGDGSLVLHARSTRSERLRNGLSLRVSPSLVPRQVQHFVSLPAWGAEVILGRNGVCWVGPFVSDDEVLASAASSTASDAAASGGGSAGGLGATMAVMAKRGDEIRRTIAASKVLGADDRRKLALVMNAIRALAAGSLPITASHLEHLLLLASRAGLQATPALLLDPSVAARFLSALP